MSFHQRKHVRYWRMCANILPDAYQSSDASRMFLGFFIVAALDLLDVLENEDGGKPLVGIEERQKWIDWIYSCQVSDGQGFRGFSGTNLGERRQTANKHWDPGNLPNTFFALCALLILGDDLGHVDRESCLAWLPTLQRLDGSFGEIVGPDGTVEGGRDLRYCCCAAGIAYILRDPAVSPYRSAFDEDNLIDYILNCQDYTGGFAESQLREPHSGLNYCAIATLELLKRLDSPASKRAEAIIQDQDQCVRWLLERQTAYIEEEELDGEDEEEEEPNETDPIDQGGKQPTQTGTEHLGLPVYDDKLGFNGRDNKIADTCYCFWNSGALAILGSLHLASVQAIRRYLLLKVQHMIGGFAKGPGSPPDVMHSYLGLAALALYGEADIQSLDPALCISKRAVSRLQYVVWRKASR